jgi:hypothetical protein
MSPLIPRIRTINLALHALDVRTREEISATRTGNMDILNIDTRAHGRAGAHEVSDAGVVFFARGAAEVAEVDVGNCEFGGELLGLQLVTKEMNFPRLDGVKKYKRKGVFTSLQSVRFFWP